MRTLDYSEPIWLKIHPDSMEFDLRNLLNGENLGKIPYDLKHLARALSLENRFSGHTTIAYSVLSHSLLVADLAKASLETKSITFEDEADADRFVLACLIHDLHEAFIGDLIGPFRRLIKEADHLVHLGFEMIIDNLKIHTLDYFTYHTSVDLLSFMLKHEEKVRRLDKIALVIEGEFFQLSTTDFPTLASLTQGLCKEIGLPTVEKFNLMAGVYPIFWVTDTETKEIATWYFGKDETKIETWCKEVSRLIAKLEVVENKKGD